MKTLEREYYRLTPEVVSAFGNLTDIPMFMDILKNPRTVATMLSNLRIHTRAMVNGREFRMDGDSLCTSTVTTNPETVDEEIYLDYRVEKIIRLRDLCNAILDTLEE